MSADFTYLVNGVDLDTELGLNWLTLETSWRAPVAARRSPVAVPGRHGNAYRQPATEFDESQMAIAVKIHGTASQAALESLVAKVLVLVTQPDTIITRISGGQTCTAYAEFVACNDKDFIVGLTDTLIVMLALPDVFWRQPHTVGSALPFESDISSAALTHLSGASAPITDAIVRVKGPHTGTVTITDAATGRGLTQESATLSGSQYLYMDAARLRSWISASATAWDGTGTDVSEHLDYPVGGPLQLWPRVEASLVEVRRNLALNPAWGPMGLPALNNAYWQLTRGLPLPVPHPLGFTHGGRCTVTNPAAGPHLASMYGVDGRPNTGSPERWTGVWVLVNKPGYRVAADGGWGAGRPELPVNTWVWVERPTAVAAGAYASLFIERIAGSPVPADAEAWFTGSLSEAGGLMGPAFSGSLSPSPSLTPHWADTPDASESYLTDASISAASEPRVRIAATGGSGRTSATELAVYAGRRFL